MPESANLNPTQMEAAIPKLKRRISELERRISELKEIDADAVQKELGPHLVSLRNKVNDTLRDIFGADTIEYEQYQVRSLSVWVMTGVRRPAHIVKEEIRGDIQDAICNFTTIIDWFKEKLDDLGKTQSGKALKTFGDLALHPEIDKASTKLFKDKHYAHAIENACKALDLLVKLRSRRNDLDGRSLMQKVFGSDKPILKFNELKTTSEKNEQQGMMFLFAGAMSALRNPRAHGFIDDDPESTLEQILFISFLAKSLDKTEKQN